MSACVCRLCELGVYLCVHMCVCVCVHDLVKLLHFHGDPRAL